MRTFAPPALFAVAALFASMQPVLQYFPGATRNSLLCVAGLSSAGAVGSGMMLSGQNPTKRICTIGLVLSDITHYGFGPSLASGSALCSC